MAHIIVITIWLLGNHGLEPRNFVWAGTRPIPIAYATAADCAAALPAVADSVPIRRIAPARVRCELVDLEAFGL
jgi:hypothetical protein